MKTRSAFAQGLRRRTVVSGIALLTVFALQPAAEAGKGSTELGVDVGVTDLEGLSDDGTRLGLRGGYRFKPWFELEGQAGHVAADEAELDARLSMLFVNGVFSFRPTARIEPYLLTGVGRAKMKLSGTGIDSVDDTSGAYQVGAGSRFFVDSDRKIAVRVEFARLRERTFDESTNYNNLTTGLTWKPGRRS